MNRRVVFLSTAEPARTPHSEWIPWALEKAGWDVTIVAPDADDSVLRRTLGAGWRFCDLPCGRLRAEWGVFSALVRARFGRHSVILVHSQGLGYRAALALAGPLFGKRLVYHNPDYYDPITYAVRSWLEGRLARKADLFISHEYHRGYIFRAQHRLRCPVLISPPNLPASWPVPPRSERLRREMAGPSPDAFVLRLHGGFSRFRTGSDLFRALTLLPPRFHLVMTGGPGGDPEPEAASLAASLGISSRVHTLPRLGFQSMLAYTASSDAGILLYANNDLGNYFQAPGRLTEYLACGLPVLAPRFAGVESLVLRYRIGRCANPADPAAIAEGILALESDVRTGASSPAEIRRRFEAHFAYEHWEKRVVAAFEDLFRAGKRGQAPPPEYWFPELPGELD